MHLSWPLFINPLSRARLSFAPLAVILALLIVMLSPVIWTVVLRGYNLIRHYHEARRLGLPILVAPVTWQDPWWLRLLPFKLGLTEIMTADPLAAVEVLSNSKTWVRPAALYSLFESFGPNVISVNGKDWQRHRKVVGPAFREQNYKLVWNESLKQAKQMLELNSVRRKQGTTMHDIREDTTTLAMNVLSSAAFGQSYDFMASDKHHVGPGHEKSYGEAMSILCQNLIMTILSSSLRVPFRIRLPGISGHVRSAVAEYRKYLRESIE